MKKILSIALMLAMMLTTVSIMPVSAEEVGTEGEVGEPVVETAAYPYFIETFDDKETATIPSKEMLSEAAWAENGVGASAGACQVTIQGANEASYAGDMRFPIDDLSYLTSKKLKLSCWIKFDTQKTKVSDDDRCEFYIWGRGADGKNDYKFLLDEHIDGNFNSGEWTYVEYILNNWDGLLAGGKKIQDAVSATFSVRPAGLNSLKTGLADDSPTRVFSYWIDEIRIEPVPTGNVAGKPQVTNCSVATNVVDGSAVTSYDLCPSWDFTAATEGSDSSLVRVTRVLENGEEATLAIEPLMSAYTIPEGMEGSKLRFDILPCEKVDDTFVFGEFASCTFDKPIKPIRSITPTLGEFDSETDTITGNLLVENYMTDPLDLFMIVALYDEDDCAIRYEVVNISAECGTSTNLPISVSTLEEEGYAPVKSAKAFVWGGTGVFDTDMTPYADVVVVEK